MIEPLNEDENLMVDQIDDPLSRNYEISINVSQVANISPLSGPSLPSTPSPVVLTTTPPKNLNSLFCCMVCYERYQLQGIHEPRVLGCGHTLCFHCLEGIFLSNLRNCCPFCKSDLNFDQATQFPANFYLLELLKDHFPPSCEDPENLSEVNYSNRLKLARLHCEYERSLLEHSRSELLQYEYLRSLAEAHIREIDRQAQLAIDRINETQKRLEKNLFILSMLYSLEEARHSRNFERDLPTHSSPDHLSSSSTSSSFISDELYRGLASNYSCSIHILTGNSIRNSPS